MKSTETSTSGRLHTVVVSSINQVPPGEWDSVGTRHGLFWTHRFFHSLETSGVEDASYYYVLVYNGSTLVGTAVLSSFVVSLDLLLPRSIQKLCSFVRKLMPRFLRIRILFCGVPISIGKHTIAIAKGEDPQAVMAKVTGVMEEIAARDKIRYLCFKEFAERDVSLCEPLKESGFFQANSVPRVLLPLRWSSYDDYLKAMRHGYRRVILESLAKLGSGEITSTEQASNAERPVLRLDQRLNCSPLIFFKLYGQVMDHTVVKLETLNARFFETVFADMRDDLRLLMLENNRKILGVALLAKSGGTLTFLFVGFDYEHRDQHAVYLNLLNGIIRHAIESGCAQIDLGQTSYWLKQRLGGQAEPMYFYLKCRRRLLHKVLRALRRFLFPATALPSPRVFR